MTTAPDYVFPVIGCRVWRWDATGLKSLNGVPWHAGKPFTAECRAQGCHEGPQAECTCGVYAGRSLDHLRRLGYTENRVYGEVSLWGRVVEHEDGWRAQFAYPKNFVVPVSVLPSAMSRIESWLAGLTAYRRDIFLLAESATVPLWLMEFGFDPKGIDLVVQRCLTLDERLRKRHEIKRGDRVAVLGYGIAVVEHADRDLVQAILGGTDVLTLDRAEVVWDASNARWETAAGAGLRLTAQRLPSGTP
jgi:hypothetical protein